MLCCFQLDNPPSGPLDINFFKLHESVTRSPEYSNVREVVGRHRLQPGEYCVVPSTFAPNEEGDFVIRFFSEKSSDAQEMDENTGESEVQVKAFVVFHFSSFFCVLSFF